MASTKQPEGIEFGGPAHYRILVQGKLTSDWSDQLAGMAISDFTASGGVPRTCLEGSIRDQTELSSVLATLHHLHMSILRLEQLDD